MPHPLQVLMDMKIWVCWYGAKIPISANGCITGANEEYASTWVTYEEARAAAEQHGYKGVSFRIPKGFGAVDIDHRTMGDLYMQTMLRRFGNTYIEKSFSGDGVHAYFQCNLDALPTCIDKDGKLCMDGRYYIKNPSNHVEVYIGGTTNHFMSITLDAIRDNPLADCTGAILTTLKKDMLKKKPVRYSEKRNGDRAIFDIVCNLRKAKNGEKFIRLYDKGDITGYGSPSEADAALCALIAFRAGKDGAYLIDEVFRTSALYREKWEREDYRAMTIDAGIEACHGTFHKSVMPHPNFIRYSEITGKPSRSYHPIREYFASLPDWDGIERVDTLFIDYLGAADNAYVRTVARKTLCAAYKRVYEPGIKFDYMPVLNGAQGIGKSTFIANLGMEWFSDSLKGRYETP